MNDGFGLSIFACCCFYLELGALYFDLLPQNEPKELNVQKRNTVTKIKVPSSHEGKAVTHAR